MKRTRLIVALVVAALVVVTAVFGHLLSRQWMDRPFDSRAWKSANGDSGPNGSTGPPDNRRALMVDDLLARKLRPGMSKQAVESMLGQPGSEGDCNAYYDLLAFPSQGHKTVAWLRWRTSRPQLAIEYANGGRGYSLRSARLCK